MWHSPQHFEDETYVSLGAICQHCLVCIQQISEVKRMRMVIGSYFSPNHM